MHSWLFLHQEEPLSFSVPDSLTSAASGIEVVHLGTLRPFLWADGLYDES